jgi:hypothetical protein
MDGSKRYIVLIPALREPEHPKSSIYLEQIAVVYIRLMYDIELQVINSIWCIPDTASSRVKWMIDKLKKIQRKIISKEAIE